MESLYNENSIIGSLFKIFNKIFLQATRPTRNLLTIFLIGLLANEHFLSVRNLHHTVLSQICNKSLNSYYHALSSEKITNAFIRQAVTRTALSIVPESLANEPIFLAVDDTTISKFGKHFDDVSLIYDHSIHEANKRMVNGHCFVSLTISIPVYVFQDGYQERIRYIPISLGYVIWNKSRSKLELACDLLDEVMPILEQKQVILTFDSWYAKCRLIEHALKYQNLDIICNARCDTALYETPVKRTGRRGRPPKYGAKLTIDDVKDFHDYGKLGKYQISHKMVKTRIFGDRIVHAYVSQNTQSKNNSKRLFFSTFSMPEMHMSTAWQENDALRYSPSAQGWFYPLKLYKLRWHIETNYYEQKTFWSLNKYMVRTHTGIERMLNLVNAAHSMTKILPYLNNKFAGGKNISSQEFRHQISTMIQREIFFDSLARQAQTTKKSDSFINSLKVLVRSMGVSA